MFGIKPAQQGAFRCQSNLVKSASDPHTHHKGRTGIGTGHAYRFQHEIFHTLTSICRHKHLQPAHIFTAEALGHQSNFHLIPWNQLSIDESRSVISCINPPQGVSHQRFSQIVFLVSLTDTFIYCFIGV